MSTWPALKADEIAAVMFDLDGTLVDTMGGFADLAALVMAARHGADPVEARARYLQTSGIPFCKQLEVIYPGHAANQAASDEFEARKLAVCEAAMMDADTLTGLRALAADGLKLVVSSNTGQPVVQTFLDREGFPFDLALGFDPAIGLAKGEPHVAQVCARFGVARHQLLFVGDSLKDAELAQAAGVPFVGRLGTFSAADFRRQNPQAATVANVIELPSLLAAARGSHP
ncbi:MAG: HAD family hydrolase [Myxococcales bacterium]|nr:HAD family hydrolase [Myxococcales bacterium]